MGDVTDTEPRTPVERGWTAIEQRWTTPIVHAGRHVTDMHASIVHFATVFGEWDVLPVIHEDGGIQAAMLQRGIYPNGTGLWGCAVCEQWHPVEVQSCPLVGKQRVAVVLGPFYHDGGQVDYIAATAAAGSFVHGQMKQGVAMWKYDRLVTHE